MSLPRCRMRWEEWQGRGFNRHTLDFLRDCEMAKEQPDLPKWVHWVASKATWENRPRAIVRCERGLHPWSGRHRGKGSTVHSWLWPGEGRFIRWNAKRRLPKLVREQRRKMDAFPIREDAA